MRAARARRAGPTRASARPRALRNALEKSAGPVWHGQVGGAAYHVITQRVPPVDASSSCARVAIESIAQKLEACDAEILVEGAPGRIGSTARKHPYAKVESHHGRFAPSRRRRWAVFRARRRSRRRKHAVRGDLMEKCQLVLCTIASTAR